MLLKVVCREGKREKGRIPENEKRNESYRFRNGIYISFYDIYK